MITWGLKKDNYYVRYMYFISSLGRLEKSMTTVTRIKIHSGFVAYLNIDGVTETFGYTQKEALANVLMAFKDDIRSDLNIQIDEENEILK